MRIIKQIITASAVMIYNVLFSQTFNNKLSIQTYISTNDSNLKFSKGLEIEYQNQLSKRFSYSINYEKSRSNDIPALNPYKNSEGTGNIKDLLSKNISLFTNETINFGMVSSHILYSPINNRSNFLYLSNGVGYALQDITYQNVIQEDYVFINKTLTAYSIEYMQKNTKTIVYLLGLGYDFTMPNNWFVGINLRGQLPIIRDKNFWNTGGGFDELVRGGIKFGKKF